MISARTISQPLDRIARRTRAAVRAWRRSGCRASRARPRRGSTPGRARAARGPRVRTPRPPEPAPERARDDREHDVVHRAAERVLDRLEVGQPALHPPIRRCGPIGTLSGTSGRRVQARPHDLAEPLGRLARAGSTERPGRPSAPSGASPPPRAACGRGPSRPRRASSASDGSGSGVQRASAGGVSGGTRREVEQHRRDVDAGHAVHQCSGGSSMISAKRSVLEPLRRSTAPTAAWSDRAAARRCGPRAAAAAARRCPAAAARCGARGSRR